MGVVELISAILLILACVFIIVIVFFQGSNKGGMSQSITGQSSDNYYQRNMGRSKEMKLKKLTAFAAALFFVIAIAVNVIAVHFPAVFGNDNLIPYGDDEEFEFNPDDFSFDITNEDDDAELDIEDNGDVNADEDDNEEADNGEEGDNDEDDNGEVDEETAEEQE